MPLTQDRQRVASRPFRWLISQLQADAAAEECQLGGASGLALLREQAIADDRVGNAKDANDEGNESENCPGRRHWRAGPCGQHGRSTELNRKSRSIAIVAAIKPQLSTDLRDERQDDAHSEPFAGTWIEILRQA